MMRLESHRFRLNLPNVTRDGTSGQSQWVPLALVCLDGEDQLRGAFGCEMREAGQRPPPVA
jgi:hypothetical protein